MKKLLKWYGSMPREIRMILAMAGLGSFIGIVYFLKNLLFKGSVPLIAIILGLAAVAAVIALLGFAINWAFGRSARRRRQEMGAELANTDSAGPTSLDARAAAEANNKKFFDNIRELRRLGISVYDLPWYVVIGDSACGKTTLINQSGMIFSTGKPEGYQLGTLNYNWWFTEDAIFVDMAGRLCNPRDDADHVEWQRFLKTIAKGRRGFPINGALACVSAEHLLRDSPDKHEEDANTMLERLRELQKTLGVTFATYLVITKCDEVVGFLPFFQRTDHDTRFTHQIVGWSRPGDYHELYDPENFSRDFDGIYDQLCEYRLRRLSDDADEEQRGLAYCFPEEFNELRTPLDTYIRTLFPYVKNPKGMKNLVFRGAYFTSATQTGELIVQHLTKRLGQGAAGSWVDRLKGLYSPKPHFLRELVREKIIPEHGLVFRHERDVARKRKVSRVLTVGTAVLAVALFSLLGISTQRFGNLIGGPKEDAEAAQKVAGCADAADCIAHLQQDENTLRGSVWPFWLALGVQSEEPADNLEQIRVRLFREHVLASCLQDVALQLRTTTTFDEPDGISFDTYRDALAAYIIWWCARTDTGRPTGVDAAHFAPLCAILNKSERDCRISDEDVEAYFDDERDNPANVLREHDPNTIDVALTNFQGHLARLAELTPDHPDPVIAEWMRIAAACRRVTQSYDAMLKLPEREIHTLAQFEAFLEELRARNKTFQASLDACRWQAVRDEHDQATMEPLRDAISRLRQSWLHEIEILRDQIPKACDGVPELGGRLQDLEKHLDDTLCNALRKNELVASCPSQAVAEADYREVYERYRHIVNYEQRGRGTAATLARHSDAIKVQGILTAVVEQLEQAVHSEQQDDNLLSSWYTRLEKLREPTLSADPPDLHGSELDDLHTHWDGTRLNNLIAASKGLRQRAAFTILLQDITRELAEGKCDKAGLAELNPRWAAPEGPSVIWAGAAGAAHSGSPKDEAAAVEPPTLDEILHAVTTSSDTREATADVTPSGSRPRGLSKEFLTQSATNCGVLLYGCAELTKPGGADCYFALSQSDGEPLPATAQKALERAWRRYVEWYAQSWHDRYVVWLPPSLESVARAKDWDTLCAALRNPTANTDFENECREALNEILCHTRWALHGQQLRNIRGIPQWPSLEERFTDALEHHWKNNLFALASSESNEDEPWKRASSGLCDAWQKLRVALAGIDTEISGPGHVRAITLDQLNRVQSEWKLHDEKLTRQLLSLQGHCLRLLDDELTNMYCTVWREHTKDLPIDAAGLPYLKPTDPNNRLAVMELMPFQEFLDAVVELNDRLTSLESSLPVSIARDQRRSFADNCRDWHKFLKADSDPAPGRQLGFSVRLTTKDATRTAGVQPKEELDHTAQNFYSKAKLQVGGWIPSDGDTRGEITVDTARTGSSSRGLWDWDAPRRDDVTFQLLEPLAYKGGGRSPDLEAATIGKHTPLAICAYLQRCGAKDAANNWYVAHGQSIPVADPDAAAAGKPKMQKVGVIFMFTPDRTLPKPIEPIKCDNVVPQDAGPGN